MARVCQKYCPRICVSLLLALPTIFRAEFFGPERSCGKMDLMSPGKMSKQSPATQASVEAVLHGLPERSALGGVQRKRVELLTMRLSAHCPAYHLLPSPEDVSPSVNRTTPPLFFSPACSLWSSDGWAQDCLKLIPGKCGQLVQVRKDAEHAGEAVKASCDRARLAQFMSGASAHFGEEAWKSVPPEADPSTLLPAKRKERKRQQIMSLVRACAAVMLACDSASQSERKGGSIPRLKAADLAGGCGHVGILLAWLFPEWEVVCVDTKLQSLQLGLERAQKLGLDNYSTRHADIRDFSEPFALGVALHACGSASDYAIRSCLKQRAAMVISPCCVGKVGMGNSGDGGPPTTMCLAQSAAFRHALRTALAASHDEADVSRRHRVIGALGGEEGGGGSEAGHGQRGAGSGNWEEESEAFVELAKAADFSDAVSGQEGWWRRLAKALVEADRMMYIQENSPPVCVGCLYVCLFELNMLCDCALDVLIAV